MVGGDAWVNRVYFRGRNIGKNSGDVGIEVDQPMYCYISPETEIIDAYSGCVYSTNFQPPASSLAGPPTTTVGAGGIDNASTTLPLAAVASTLATEGVLTCEGEVMHYEVQGATQVKVRRGINGTVATAHAAGATVTFVEYKRQRIDNYARTSRVASTTCRGFMMLQNSGLPMSGVKLGGSHARLNDVATQGEAVYISGQPGKVQFLDSFECDARGNANSVGSHVFLNRPGATGAAGTMEVWPEQVEVGDITMRASGTLTATSFTFIRLEAGYWDLHVGRLLIESGLRGVAGQVRGISAGSVASSIKADIKSVTVRNFDQGDGAMAPVRFDGLASLIRATIDLLDYEQMNVSGVAPNGNYFPYGGDAKATIIGRIIHPFNLGNSQYAFYPPRPKRWAGARSASATITHDEEYVPVDTGAAAGPVTITLPMLAGGNASSLKPGDGAEVVVLDVANSAATKNIIIQANANDKMMGALGGSVTINTNGGKIKLAGHSSLGWWQV